MNPPDISAFDKLKECRRFGGPSKEFWPKFIDALCDLAGAATGILMMRNAPDEPLKPFARFPTEGTLHLPVALNSPDFKQLTAAAFRDGSAEHTTATETVLVIRLETNHEMRGCIVVLTLPTTTEAEIDYRRDLLVNASDTICLYEQRLGMEQSASDVTYFAEALDVMVQLNRITRYLEACMALCNELAERRKCSRVSLGWLKRPYLRVKAISNMSQFEKKMDVVQELEQVMEEAYDQDEEIVHPAPVGSTFIDRDHANFAREEQVGHIASLPIRVGEQRVGVVTLERDGEPFGEEELKGIRVLIDQAGRRLYDLSETDRWFGARMASGFRKAAAKLLGFEHTWAKLAALVALAGLLFLIFAKGDYRVEGDFIVRSDALVHLPAPFDGFLETAPYKVGDFVGAGDVLVSLDRSELLLEEASILAEIQRRVSEAENAENQRELAGMRVAQSLRAQAEARLALIRFRIEQATLEAPFDGVIVSGDLRDRTGAPVATGDILMQLTRLEDLYFEIKVPERDIHEIIESRGGQVAFISRPEAKFDISVERIEPMAMPEPEGNVFIVRADAIADPETWWRPGMSGVAKIDVGKRSYLWIFTHRLVDFLRLLLWW